MLTGKITAVYCPLSGLIEGCLLRVFSGRDLTGRGEMRLSPPDKVVLQVTAVNCKAAGFTVYDLRDRCRCAEHA